MENTQVIAFPVKGVNRTLARSTQPEGTAYDMLNMLPFDRNGRLRGAKRPGLAKLWAAALGSGSQPLQHLGQTTIALDPLSVTANTLLAEDTFTYSDGNLQTVAGTAVWKTYSDSATQDATRFVVSGGVIPDDILNAAVAVYQPTLVLGSAYVISMDARTPATSRDIHFSLGARLNKAAPATGFPGVWANVNAVSGTGALSVSFGTTVNGTNLLSAVTTAAGAIAPDTTYTIQLRVNGDVFQLWVNGVKYAQITTTSSNTQSGVGFGRIGSNNTGYWDNFQVYTGTNLATYRQTNIVAVCGGNVYQGDFSTQATIVAGGTAQLRDTGLVSEAYSTGFYYLVDGLSIRKLKLATREMVTYAATAGTAPSGAVGACMYRDRLVLWDNQQNFYFSRLGGHTDWDYTQTDPAAAFTGNASVSGRIGEPIVAIFPFSDDQLAIGGDHNLWVVRGDLADGGSIDLISDAIGILGPKAWTKAPDGTVYMVGTGGLYRWPPGGNPVCVSDVSWNEFFSGLNRATNYIHLSWNRDSQGLMLFVTPANTAPATHLWYDKRTSSDETGAALFPQQFPDTVGPICSLVYDGDGPLDRVTVFGGRDGYVRALNNNRLHDDGPNINAYVDILIQLGDGRNDGILGDVQLTYGEIPSNLTAADWGVKCELRAGLTAHQVTAGTGYRKVLRDFGAMQGRVTGTVQKLRGAFGLMRIYESTTKYFSFENAIVTIESAGKTRR